VETSSVQTGELRSLLAPLRAGSCAAWRVGACGTCSRNIGKGHRFLAGSYFDLLEARGVVKSLLADGLDPVRPAPEPTNRPPSKFAQALWLSTAGTQWMIRRSTDLLPGLARLAWAEWRHGSPSSDLELPDLLDPVPGKVA